MKAVIAYALCFLTILGLVVWWEVYRFQDCKRVGHATAYCIFTIGK